MYCIYNIINPTLNTPSNDQGVPTHLSGAEVNKRYMEDKTETVTQDTCASQSWLRIADLSGRAHRWR